MCQNWYVKCKDLQMNCTHAVKYKLRQIFMYNYTQIQILHSTVLNGLCSITDVFYFNKPSMKETTKI
jgi:hypothetical protein